jgi:hypothetical protein
MKKFISMFLLIAFIGCGSLAYAGDSENDCNCTKGGLGLKISRFVVGFGVKHFNSKPGCDTAVGLGIGLGSDQSQVRFGFGFDSGVLSIGLTFKGEYETVGMGFGVGLDYGDCRMVWPIEE